MRWSLLLCCHLLLAQMTYARQQHFVRDYWLNENNTPVRVNALARDGTGYMWLGTDEGLFRFNGTSFTRIADSVHQPVTALAWGDGRLWIGYKTGAVASMTDPVHIVPLSVKGRMPGTTVTSLLPGGGALFIGTAGEGIYMIVQGESRVLGSSSGLSDDYIYSLDYLLQPGSPSHSLPFGLIAGTDGGINIIRQQKGAVTVASINSASGEGVSDNIVRVLCRIGGGNEFLAGLQEKGFNILRTDGSGSWRALAGDTAWEEGQINDIIAADGQKAWIATDNGLVAYDSGGTQYILPGKKINKIQEDGAGNVWCATNDGVSRVSVRYADYTALSPPYSLGAVTAMACTGDQYLWYSQDRQLWRMALDGGKAEKVLEEAEVITSLFADVTGSIWIGTLGKGLYYRSPAGTLRAVRDLADCYKNTHVLSIARSGDRIWISTLNGVQEMTINEAGANMVTAAKAHTKQSGIGSDYVYQLFPDSRHQMWMATDGGGVCRYDGAAYQHWDAATGFPGKVVYTLTEDAAGHIWAGTLDNGLFEFDGHRWYRYGRKEGLQDVSISSLMANRSGQVIIVHRQSIDEWFPRSRQFRHFNRRLGVDLDSVSRVLNCLSRDDRGNVYVPFEHGFIRFLNIAPGPGIRPNVVISDISLFFKPVTGDKKTFLHDENHLSFRFDGINFTNPERQHYRYRLQGYNDDWVYTNDEYVTFPQLPPGSYRFRVQVSLSDSFVQAAEDQYSFVIKKPLWQRWWALLLAGLAVAAIAYAVVKAREQNIRKVALLQKERMIAEYDQLKSQVNPHFLFNSLNTLINLIEEDQEQAVRYTSSLSDLYRNMLAYRNHDTITLGEEWEILEKYFFIQQSRFGKALQLQACIPPELMKVKKVVPMALQMLVENAIKHNVVSRAQPLKIHIEAGESYLKICNVLNLKSSAEKGAGISMINIRSRYALLTRAPVQYGIQGNEYIVKLPLL